MKIAISAAAVALAAFFAAGTANAAGSCVMAGGTADMITEDLARFMANAALNNSMKAAGLEGHRPGQRDVQVRLPDQLHGQAARLQSLSARN